MWAEDREYWDAVVIGAGPAGTVAARLLALGGARVLLVERKALPRRKVCGACWNAGGLQLLRAIGAGERVSALGGCELHHFRLCSRNGETSLPMPGGLAVSRAAMDTALVQHAVQAGVCFVPNVRALVGRVLPQCRLVRLHGEEGHVPTTRDVEAGVVIAADGLGRPSLCDFPEFKQPAAAGSRIGAGCEVKDFPQEYEAGTIYMAVGRCGYVGAVLVESGVLNVAAALDPSFVSQCGSLSRAAAEVLREAHREPIPAIADAGWRGTPLLTRRATNLAGTRLFLLGDSAGYAEPFTGEGMTWAVLSACAVQPLAQQAWRMCRPELARTWTATHNRAIGQRQRVAWLVAQLLRNEFAVSGLAKALTLLPGVASLMLRQFQSPRDVQAVIRRIVHELPHSRAGDGCPGACDEPGGISGARAARHLPDRAAGASSHGAVFESGGCQAAYRASSHDSLELDAGE